MQSFVDGLFDEWFVRRQFPNSKIESTPTLSNELPEGWRRASVADIASYVNRGIAPKYDANAGFRVINQKCIRNGRLNLEAARFQTRPVPKEKLVRQFDVLVNSTGVGTLGRVAQVLDVVPQTTIDTHVSIVRPRQGIDPHFFGIQLIGLQSLLEHAGKGSTGQTELSRGSISGMPLLLPPAHLRNRFGYLVGPMREHTQNLLSQNAVLRAARDLLLPKLISGEIDLSGAEHEVEHTIDQVAAE